MLVKSTIALAEGIYVMDMKIAPTVLMRQFYNVERKIGAMENFAVAMRPDA